MASIMRSLNTDWATVADSPAARRALMRWTARHPELGAARSVDDFVDTRSRPEWGDQAQRALAAEAPTDEIAARTLLQALLGGLATSAPARPRRSRRRRRGGVDGMEPDPHLPEPAVGAGGGERAPRRAAGCSGPAAMGGRPRSDAAGPLLRRLRARRPRRLCGRAVVEELAAARDRGWCRAPRWPRSSAPGSTVNRSPKSQRTWACRPTRCGVAGPGPSAVFGRCRSRAEQSRMALSVARLDRTGDKLRNYRVPSIAVALACHTVSSAGPIRGGPPNPASSAAPAHRLRVVGAPLRWGGWCWVRVRSDEEARPCLGSITQGAALQLRACSHSPAATGRELRRRRQMPVRRRPRPPRRRRRPPAPPPRRPRASDDLHDRGTTTATPPPGTTPEQEVIDRYVGYWNARFTANEGTPGSRTTRRCAEFATGEQLDAVIAETQSNLDEGLAFQRPAEPTTSSGSR